MRVGICDDEKLFRNKLIKMCNEYSKQNNFILDLVEFESGENLLEYSNQIDLLFLDIELPGLNGLEVKDKLEKEEKVSRIIFTTSHREAVFEAFGRKTIGFLIKPIAYEEFCKKLDKVNRDIEDTVTIEIEMDGKLILLKCSDIQYIEAQSYYSKIITFDNSYLIRRSLNEWESLLSSNNFFRIHKSYLVNMAYIKNIRSAIILENGMELKVGRTKHSEFTEAYNNYIRKKMR